MRKLIENDIKTAIINMFSMLKKVERRVSILRRKMEDFFLKDPNWTSRDKKSLSEMNNTMEGINSLIIFQQNVLTSTEEITQFLKA